MRTDELPVLAEIRRELLEGIKRHPRRTRSRWAAAVAVAPVLAIIAAVGLAVAPPADRGPALREQPQASSRPAAAFTIEDRADGRIHVTVRSDFDQSEQLRDELQRRGIDVAVIDIAAHPLLVGTIEILPQSPEGMEIGDGEFWIGDSEFWIDPQRLRGRAEVLIYRETDDNERWMQAPSVFHPDEPLGGLPCALDGPMDAATLDRYARKVGIERIEWQEHLGPPPTDRSFETEPVDQRPPEGQFVVSAVRRGPTTLAVELGLPPPPGFINEDGKVPSPSMSLNTHSELYEGIVCTPELAARWPQR